MEIILFFIPFIVAFFLLIFYKEKVTFFEYIVLICSSIIITLSFSWIFKSSKTSDIEYFGGYVEKIRHYDDWDEWIDRTCTREVAVGKDSDGNTIYETEEYDCSYRAYHNEYWIYVDNLSKNEHILTEEQFNEILNRFNHPQKVFVDMHRNYYRKDGDAQDYYWPKTRNTIRTITTTHYYKNKVRKSNSIFKFEKITKKQAKELNLFEYPKIDNLDQNTILTNSINVNQEEIETIKYINGYYGKLKQFRLFVLLFPSNVGIEQAFKQQAYWEGGNKNELIVCFGVNSDRTVDWCYSFSWEDEPFLSISTMEKYRNNEKLNISEYGEWLIQNLNNWKRKEFKDFEYIKVQLTNGEYIALFIIVILINTIISWIIVNNCYVMKKFVN